ncbi:MAG: LLM class flavin-dependent oxidoreductase, partial [Acidimicrobiales bacterium]|nr:LLM class flavin-dependent oxidoreductase [Acidimicrobiales bacterium]
MLLDTVLTTDLADCGRHARELADAGFAGAFTYEGQTDPFFPLVPAALEADIDLYTNVAIALPRSPMHLAYQAWDLQRASNGRFMLGLGSQIKPHIERRYSALWDKPVAQMRDLIRATKAIFEAWQNETPLHYEGPYYQHTLSIPPLTPKPLTHATAAKSGSTAKVPPIWAGALGPMMTKMVAAEADGIIIHPFNSAHFLREHSRRLVTEAQAAAGRDLT